MTGREYMLGIIINQRSQKFKRTSIEIIKDNHTEKTVTFPARTYLILKSKQSIYLVSSTRNWRQ